MKGSGQYSTGKLTYQLDIRDSYGHHVSIDYVRMFSSQAPTNYLVHYSSTKKESANTLKSDINLEQKAEIPRFTFRFAT